MSIASELMRPGAADILHHGMNDQSSPSWVERAARFALGLALACAPVACAGPGLEPPVDHSAGDGDGDTPGRRDAGGPPPASGGTGGTSGPMSPGTDDGGAGGDPDEASMDAAVDDEDAGAEPGAVEP